MRITLLLSFFLKGLGLCAQNLVPNGSFEEYTNCPEFFGYAQYATGWLNLHTNSADYFNRCQENVVVGVPFNSFGYQEPAHGDAYMGMATTFPGLDQYREIVGIELVAPLEAGVPVCISFKVAVGGFGSWDGNSAIYTSKGLGVRFFNQFPVDWPAYLYPNAAALHMDLVPADTAIWYTMSAEYVPDSNYTLIAIGNFFADSLSSITDLDTAGFGTWGVSYVYVDDVGVYSDPEYCGSSGVNSIREGHHIRAYPNPSLDDFSVLVDWAAQGQLRWEVVDAIGQQVLTGSSLNSAGTINISTNQLLPGTYFLRIINSAAACTPLRLVKLSP